MPTIDELNFKVILDDAEFNATIRKDIKAAKEYNMKLSDLLDIKKSISQTDVSNARISSRILVDQTKAQEKITRETQKTAAAQEILNEKIAREGDRTRTAAAINQQKLTRETIKTARAQRQLNAATSNHSNLFKKLTSVAAGYFSLQAGGQLLSSLMRITGEFELQRTTLGAILGDLDKADGIVSQIKELAVKSPFEFKELATYAKQLSAYSVPTDEIFETTKMLADVSAGLGVGMDRLILAYGQVRSAAFLRGTEVRQFTEAGIPILEELAKQFSELEGRAVSVGEVFDKISLRLVPFEMVAKTFKDMTSEGGKFYMMQEIQAETLSGKISNLKDAYEIMMSEIGERHSDKLKGAVDSIRSLVENWENVGRVLAELIVTFGVYKTAVFGINNATKLLELSQLKLVRTFRILKVVIARNPYVAIAAAVTAAGYAIYKCVTHLEGYEKIQKTVSDNSDRYNAQLGAETAKLDALYAKLQLAKEGTEEYNKAKAQIQSKYGNYIRQLEQEGVAVDNLADIYDKLKSKLEESAKKRFFDTAKQDLEQEYTNQFDGIFKSFQRQIKIMSRSGNELSALEKETIWQFVIGQKDFDEMMAGLSSNIQHRIYRSGALPILKTLKNDFKTIQDAYAAGLADIENAYSTSIAKNDLGLDEKAEELSRFAKTVREVLKKYGIDGQGEAGGLWADKYTDYYDYLKNLRDTYKEIGDKIKDAGITQQQNLPKLKEQKRVVEAIAAALGVSLTESGGNGKSVEQEAIESRIRAIEKLQDVYEKFKPFIEKGLLSEDELKENFKNYFSSLSESYGEAFVEDFDFKERFKKAIAELEKFSPKAASDLNMKLEGSLFDADLNELKDKEKQIKSLTGTIGKYYKQMSEWAGEDFNIEGTGLTHDISKILSELKNKFAEIEERAQKMGEMLREAVSVEADPVAMSAIKQEFEAEFGEGVWNKFWEEYVTDGESAIDAIAKKEKDANRIKSQDKLMSLASSKVKELTEGLNLSDWADKSLHQINQIQAALMRLLSGDGFNITNSTTIERAKELGISLEDLESTIKGILAGEYRDVTVEKFKKLQQAASKTSSLIGGLGDTLKSLGEATGSDGLIAFAETLDVVEELASILIECDSLWNGIAETVGEATDATGEVADAAGEVASEAGNIAKSSDWITVVIKLVLLIIKQIANAISGANATQQAMADAARDYKEQLYEASRIKFDGVFGTNKMGLLTQNLINSKKALEDFKSSAAGIQKEKDFGSGGLVTFWDFLTFGIARNLSKKGTALNAQKISGLDQLAEMFPDIYNPDGSLNMEYIKSMLPAWNEAKGFSSGWALSEGLKAALHNAVADYDLYVEEMDKFRQSIKDIYSDISSSIADNMVDAWLESGDALSNLTEATDEFKESLFRMMVQSMLAQKFMDKFSNDIDKIAEDYINNYTLYGQEEADKIFARDNNALIDNIADYVSGAANYVEALGKALGLTPGKKEISSGLSDGIKGITEDTADLRASYINAIRADVSYGKTLWLSMGISLKTIIAMLYPIPTIVDYMAKIQANTYNTSVNTSMILAEMRSVITNEDGGCVKVLMS